MVLGSSEHSRQTDTHLTASFSGQPVQEPVPETNLHFNEARDDEVAMASDGPYVDHLHMQISAYPFGAL